MKTFKKVTILSSVVVFVGSVFDEDEGQLSIATKYGVVQVPKNDSVLIEDSTEEEFESILLQNKKVTDTGPSKMSKCIDIYLDMMVGDVHPIRKDVIKRFETEADCAKPYAQTCHQLIRTKIKEGKIVVGQPVEEVVEEIEE